MRWYYLVICSALLLRLFSGTADAFLGFGGTQDSGASGLDLVQGYDRNTVVTVSGRVAAVPDASADPITVELLAGTERLIVVLSPRWYLQDDSLDWKVNDPLTVRGARAQGKDGRSYLLAQQITGPTGAQLILRSASGRPAWSRNMRDGGSQDMIRRGNPMMQQRGMGGMGGRPGR
jgi:hypothetical protein